MAVISRQPIGNLLSELSTDTGRRLLDHNDRVMQGYSVDLRTPLYDGRPRPELIENWGNLLYPGIDKYPWIRELENSERDMIGPISLRAPWSEREEDLNKYWYSPDVDLRFDPEIADSFARVANIIVKNSLRPTSLEYAFATLPKNTNWGLPLLSRDLSDHKYYLQRARAILEGGGSFNESVFPAVLYWRGQMDGDTPKQRNVWGMDHAPTILDKTFVEPIVKILKRAPEYAAWLSLDAVDHWMTEAFQTGPEFIYSIDYSGFDVSISPMLIDYIAHIFSEWFPSYTRDTISFLFDVFKYSGIVVPGWVWTGRNGSVPSGDGKTNLVDSLINSAMCRYLRVDRYTVMGDDAVLLDYRGSLDKSLISGRLSKLGLKINDRKTMVSSDTVHYLQRMHHKEYVVGGLNVGVRSTMRTLGSMMSYEAMRPGWSGAMDTLRWIMQLENCKWHPMFPKFVEWYTKGDDLIRLALKPLELVKEAGGAEHVSETLGIRAFPWLQGDVSSLSQFETVKIIKELAP